ncbi:MAG: STAS domain-containing protein [Bdellovibrionia bacterium]
MQAKLIVQGDVTVVSLSGRLAIERTPQLKRAFVENLSAKKVVFCLNELNFVGSSGIQMFFNLLEDFKKNQIMDVKVAGLNPDFKRLWMHNLREIELHESVEKAVESYCLPQDF